MKKSQQLLAGLALAGSLAFVGVGVAAAQDDSTTATDESVETEESVTTDESVEIPDVEPGERRGPRGEGCNKSDAEADAADADEADATVESSTTDAADAASGSV